ncbi:hypothetical protein DPMN_102257 [Dreissena polymorpha]|uniref:Uncharacterized protein n=1 Tax=Dreissena polymorpha TaxID=45954 RepID=A0A9D4LKS0_DREPO|nr:hypothetical protein DPMN_102257 [Dreissena polymorpha]
MYTSTTGIYGLVPQFLTITALSTGLITHHFHRIQLNGGVASQEKVSWTTTNTKTVLPYNLKTDSNFTTVHVLSTSNLYVNEHYNTLYNERL